MGRGVRDGDGVGEGVGVGDGVGEGVGAGVTGGAADAGDAPEGLSGAGGSIYTLSAGVPDL